jgi:tetratricopeptide (TPR) repeat protein
MSSQQLMRHQMVPGVLCASFMEHLFWHKPRLVTLGPKVEALPDGHPSKLECLFQLSRLFRMVGNNTERKRLLAHALKLSREQGDDHQLVRTLRQLSDVYLLMGLYKEGIQHVKEALEISERLGDTKERARCLEFLAWLLCYDNQLDAAEEAVSRAIDLQEEGEQFLACKCHRTLGAIYQSKGKTEEAVRHFEVALRIASSFNWLNQLFCVHFSLAVLFADEDRFDDAHTHIEHAKSHAVNGHNMHFLACAMRWKAGFWHQQNRFEEAKSEALCAVDIFEKLGAEYDVKGVRGLLRRIDNELEEIDGLFTLMVWVLVVFIDPSHSDRATGLGWWRRHLS